MFTCLWSPAGGCLAPATPSHHPCRGQGGGHAALRGPPLCLTSSWSLPRQSSVPHTPPASCSTPSGLKLSKNGPGWGVAVCQSRDDTQMETLLSRPWQQGPWLGVGRSLSTTLKTRVSPKPLVTAFHLHVPLLLSLPRGKPK